MFRHLGEITASIALAASGVAIAVLCYAVFTGLPAYCRAFPADPSVLFQQMVF